MEHKNIEYHSNSKDESSYANIDDIVMTHYHLSLVVDFSSKKLKGTNKLDFLTQRETSKVILDVHGLNVADVTDGEGRKLFH
jgi:aminopeptidase N